MALFVTHPAHSAIPDISARDQKDSIVSPCLMWPLGKHPLIEKFVADFQYPRTENPPRSLRRARRPLGAGLDGLDPGAGAGGRVLQQDALVPGHVRLGAVIRRRDDDRVHVDLLAGGAAAPGQVGEPGYPSSVHGAELTLVRSTTCRLLPPLEVPFTPREARSREVSHLVALPPFPLAPPAPVPAGRDAAGAGVNVIWLGNRTDSNGYQPLPSRAPLPFYLPDISAYVIS